MDGGLLRFLLPQIPAFANTALWHTLGKTPTASQWDLRTELTVQALRYMMTDGGGGPSPVGKVQATYVEGSRCEGQDVGSNGEN